jgi:hypothetical protein
MDKTSAIIAQLKEVKRSKGYSLQRIADMTEAAGEPVSMSTIKRVFGADSDRYDFRYDSTIRPIATVLLDEPPEVTQAVEDRDAEIDALKRIVDLKNDEIERLKLSEAEKAAEIENSQRVLKHKNRMEMLMCCIIAALVFMLLLFDLVDVSEMLK